MIDCLENLSVDINSFLTFKCNSHLLECIGKPLDSDTNWPMSHVRNLSLFDRIVIAINNSVEIFSHSLCNFMQSLVIKGLSFVISEF